VVSFTPQPLYSQGKSPWYALDRRLVGLSVKLVNMIKVKCILNLLLVLATLAVMDKFLSGCKRQDSLE
jgi:hypothetical protein